MAVAYAGSAPAITPATGSTKTSGNWTITGSNLAIIIQVSLKDATATVSSVSWSLGSGTTVEVKNGRDTSNAFTSIWAVPAPTAGTGTYTVNLSGSVPYQINGDYFTGADQTTPCPTGDAVSSLGIGNSVTLTPANLTANDATSAALGNAGAQNVTSVSPHQTFLDNTSAINLETGYNTGTTGVTVNVDQTGIVAARIGVRIVAAAAGGAARPTPQRSLTGVGR